MLLIQTTKKEYKVLAADKPQKLVHIRAKVIKTFTDDGFKVTERDAELNSITLSKRGRPKVTILLTGGVANIRNYAN